MTDETEGQVAHHRTRAALEVVGANPLAGGIYRILLGALISALVALQTYQLQTVVAVKDGLSDLKVSVSAEVNRLDGRITYYDDAQRERLTDAIVRLDGSRVETALRLDGRVNDVKEQIANNAARLRDLETRLYASPRP